VKGVTTIDTALLDAVTRAARAAPRRRKNFNLHANEADACNRLLNAVEPDSYIVPHRHLDPGKDETFVVLRGRFGVATFDDDGKVSRTYLLGAEYGCVGIDIPHGTWHTLVALESGSIFLEAKGGPYAPLGAAERASWAPAENSPDAAAYLAKLRALFD
jgi:cupin fold WbuC family metalloprotein